MSAGAWVVVAAVAAALCFGAYRAVTDGRFRARRPESAWDHIAPALPEAELGERATFVQFSSAFCAPCRATRRTLSDVADTVSGVRHLEVDAEHHLELVRRLGVVRTPTTVVLDARGHEVARAAGAPRKEQVLNAIAGLSA